MFLKAAFERRTSRTATQGMSSTSATASGMGSRYQRQRAARNRDGRACLPAPAFTAAPGGRASRRA